MRMKWLQLTCLAAVVMSSNVCAERTLVTEGVVTAPVAEVWKAFTTADGFESWAVPHAEIDLRIGGDIRTSYKPDAVLGDDSTIINRILSFEPQRMLSIRNVLAPKGFENAELFGQTWSVIHFEPIDRERTHVRIVGLGYGQGPQWDDIYQKFKAGNAWTLDKLQKKFAPNEMTDDPNRVMALLDQLVGGDWIHESTLPSGGVFRVRNVIERAPDETSLLSRGWLGDSSGMFAHGAGTIWREPGTTPDAAGQVRFLNIDEHGSIARGPIRLIGCDSVEWDWNSTSKDATTSRYRITMSFTEADRYSMKIDLVGDDGTFSTMVNADFARVSKAPAEFMTIRRESNAD